MATPIHERGGGEARWHGVASLIAWLLFAWPVAAWPRVLFDFADGIAGWRIPAWARAHESYVGVAARHDSDDACGRHGSLRLELAFDGDRWQRAMVAVLQPMDLRGHDRLSFRVRLDESAPPGITATAFLLVGDALERVEVERLFRPEAGRWTLASVSLLPGGDGWRRPFDRADVRGLELAVEKYRGRPLRWRGSVLFDEVTLHPAGSRPATATCEPA